MKTYSLAMILASLLLAGCGLSKAEVGLPPTEAMGGAVKIMSVPLLESVNWCAGNPCRLTPPVSYNIQQFYSPSWNYGAPTPPYWVPVPRYP